MRKIVISFEFWVSFLSLLVVFRLNFILFGNFFCGWSAKSGFLSEWWARQTFSPRVFYVIFPWVIIFKTFGVRWGAFILSIYFWKLYFFSTSFGFHSPRVLVVFQKNIPSFLLKIPFLNIHFQNHFLGFGGHFFSTSYNSFSRKNASVNFGSDLRVSGYFSSKFARLFCNVS